jgi:hypothetical protein
MTFKRCKALTFFLTNGRLPVRIVSADKLWAPVQSVRWREAERNGDEEWFERWNLVRREWREALSELEKYDPSQTYDTPKEMQIGNRVYDILVSVAMNNSRAYYDDYVRSSSSNPYEIGYFDDSDDDFDDDDDHWDWVRIREARIKRKEQEEYSRDMETIAGVLLYANAHQRQQYNQQLTLVVFRTLFRSATVNGQDRRLLSAWSSDSDTYQPMHNTHVTNAIYDRPSASNVWPMPEMRTVRFGLVPVRELVDLILEYAWLRPEDYCEAMITSLLHDCNTVSFRLQPPIASTATTALTEWKSLDEKYGPRGLQFRLEKANYLSFCVPDTRTVAKLGAHECRRITYFQKLDIALERFETATHRLQVEFDWDEAAQRRQRRTQRLNDDEQLYGYYDELERDERENRRRTEEEVNADPEWDEVYLGARASISCLSKAGRRARIKEKKRRKQKRQ